MAWPAVLQDVGFRNMTARKSVCCKSENKVRNTELSCMLGATAVDAATRIAI